MNERRFRAVLEETAKTIHSYGEEEIFAAFRVIAERFGWELAKKDPGPCCCLFGDWYDAQGIMTPLHECPADAPAEEDELTIADEALLAAVGRSVAPARVVDLRKGWN